MTTWKQHELELEAPQRRAAALERDRKACRAIAIIKAGRKAKKDDATIVAELAKEGLTWNDQDF